MRKFLCLSQESLSKICLSYSQSNIRLSFYSEVGGGTEFEVYLPAVEGPQMQQAEGIELPKGNGELILVIDDELAIREVTKKQLSMGSGITEVHTYCSFEYFYSKIFR